MMMARVFTLVLRSVTVQGMFWTSVVFAEEMVLLRASVIVKETC